MPDRMPPPEPSDRLDVQADGAHVYAVTVTGQDGARRHYRVGVPESLLAELNLEPPDEPSLVRAGLELMLRRPGASMPEEFDLDQAEQSYPGLLAELQAATGR